MGSAVAVLSTWLTRGDVERKSFVRPGLSRVKSVDAEAGAKTAVEGRTCYYRWLPLVRETRNGGVVSKY
jgi:hypothetical protein